jgi:hypothetical protein
MGWSLSWAALKSGNLQTACAALDLRSTGKREEIAESKIVGTQLPTGWYLVVFNRTEIKDKTLEKLSRAGEVVGCFVEDHVMFSSASAWNKGRRVWYVAHNGEEDRVLHLETSGDLPAEFESIRQKVFAKQEQETAEQDDLKVDHVYELPAELAKKLTGFRHDEPTPGLTGDAFEVLERESVLGKLIGHFGRRNTSAA